MVSDFYRYPLPEALIAPFPTRDRDRCRLLALDRHSGKIDHRIFSDLVDLLPENAMLVLNHSRVLPARIRVEKENGTKTDVLFLESCSGGEWIGLGKRLKSGMRLRTGSGHWMDVRAQESEKWRFYSDIDGLQLAIQDGEMPLPPYIVKARERRGLAPSGAQDRDDYQAVYAKTLGSVAAPTAGLHFTEALLQQLKEKGIAIAELCLHVGWGTFAPMRSARVEEHRMHAETFDIEPRIAREVTAAKRDGRPIVAVGSTVVRALESAWEAREEVFKAGSQTTSLFIRPGYRFGAVDQMITNFHLPMSSLLAMVMAFAGEGHIQAAYEEAMRLRYRFYSYGDAMWIY